MSRVKLIYQIMHNIVMFKKFQTCILQVKYIATIPEVPHSQKKGDISKLENSRYWMGKMRYL